VLEELEKHKGDFDGENLKVLLKNVAESNKISFSKLMMSMRTALSGLKVGSTILFIYHQI
jgi:Anticodon binding domain